MKKLMIIALLGSSVTASVDYSFAAANSFVLTAQMFKLCMESYTLAEESTEKCALLKKEMDFFLGQLNKDIADQVEPQNEGPKFILEITSNPNPEEDSKLILTITSNPKPEEDTTIQELINESKEVAVTEETPEN
jgi:hypothetical protein